MSDGLSPYSDTRADLQTQADQWLKQRDRITACAEKLNAKKYSAEIAEEISKELLPVRASLTEFECGRQFVSDLVVVNQLVMTQSDHRSVKVIHSCLQKLAAYLEEIAEHGVDSPVSLLVAFNELNALRKKPLITENLLSVPDQYRIDITTLQLVDNNSASATVPARYLGFSQTMLGIYRGENRENRLRELAGFFDNLADETTEQKTVNFWLLCKAFVSTVENPKGELSPALFTIFKQLESVLLYAIGDTQNQVLGMQQVVDRLLVNLLCYTHAYESQPGFVVDTVHFADVNEELARLHQSQSIQSSNGSAASSLWMQTSSRVLADRLRHCSAILSEEALKSDESIEEFSEEIALLKRLLILLGVHGVRENIEEVEAFIRKPLSSEILQSCYTSVQLVEQQMLYQFGFLNESASDETGTYQSEPLQTAIKSPLTEPQEEQQETDTVSAGVTASVSPQFDPEDFGTRCNSCIDVIQQSLDTALGSSGNLIPDSSVVNALSKLIDLVSAEGIDELTGLLTPLSQMLTNAEGSTLNQSETLLVQEAIIAATLGVDSLLGQKPMPELVADVSTRVEELQQLTSQRLGSGLQSNSTLAGFLVEAQELLPRLFELFQRLRAVPDGASRLYSDINRLLHSFIVSANEAEEQQLAELAHALESTMVDLTQSNAPASQAFFDLAIETIECLDEDIERLRNSETPIDRSNLIDSLKLEAATEEPRAVQQQSEFISDDQVLSKTAPSQTSPDSKPAAKETGVVLLNDSALLSQGIDWEARFQRIEACCQGINTTQKQLLELQNKTEQIVQSINSSQINSDQARSSAESEKALQSLAEQLQQITESQNTSVKTLNHELNTATLIDAASLAGALVSAVEAAADAQGLQVQFAIQTHGVLLHKTLVEQLSVAIAELLSSIVTHTLSGNALTDPATLTFSVSQNECTTFIEVADDGCGVTVEGVKPRSDNPWAQVARPDWRDVSGQPNKVPPQVWSRQSDDVINISGLLKVAARYGGTVAINSTKAVTAYRLCLPVLESIQDVLVISVGDHLMAVPAAKVESVGFTEQASVTSLGRLIGIENQTAANQATEEQSISVNTVSGLQQFSVSQVIGHRRLTFSTADRVLPDIPGYTGVSVESEQLIMLLDMDYWGSQQYR